MVQKQSWIFLADNTNVRWVRVFHLYKGSFRKHTTTGLFIKGSARVVEPPRIEYKGFKYRYKVRGDICRLWLVRSNLRELYLDQRWIQFRGNAGLNINKKVNIMSKYINGPITKSLRRKKLVSLFKTIV